MKTQPISYTIRHSHGQTETGFASYGEALEAVHAVYSDPVVGHDGDISQGGSRTLVWTSEELADNDEGSRACCSIVEVQS